jgi:SM-20-related protein
MNLPLSLPVVWWSEFCDEDLISLIQHQTRVNEPNFVPTTVSTGEADYRKSLVSWHHQWPELHRRFTQRIEQVLPAVRDEMGDYCPLQHAHTQVEVQMTVHHRNGDNFRTHIDNASPDTYGRRLTFVYYYQLSETKNFTGGDLVIKLKGGEKRIDPKPNTIVFFASSLYHTVEPVTVPTELFEDGRHSLVGWIHG